MVLVVDKLLEKILGRINTLILRLKGTTIEGKLTLMLFVDIPRGHSKLYLSNRVILDRNVSIIISSGSELEAEGTYKIKVGKNVYINRFTVIDASRRIEIGDNSMIGTHCYITDHDHGFILAENPTVPIGELPLLDKSTIIGKNVWIGSNVTILKGVEIGDNCIIGAGSVVTKSVPENSIAVGVPCKAIRNR